MRSLRDRLTNGLLWVLGGTIASRSVGLLSSVLVARILGKDEFGKLGMIQSTIGMAGTFAGLGMGAAATKYVGTLRVMDLKRTGRVVGLLLKTAIISSIITAIGLLTLSNLVALHVLHNGSLNVPICVSAGLLIFGIINGVQTGALAGLEEFKMITRNGILSALVTLICVCLGAKVGGLLGTISGLVIGLAAGCWFNSLSLAHAMSVAGIEIDFRSSWKERSIFLEFLIPTTLSAIMTAPVSWLGNVILVRDSGGFSALGDFNVAQQWQNLILFVPGAIAPIFLAVLSNTHGLGDRRKYWKVVKISVFATALPTAVIAAVVVVLANRILWLYGTGYGDDKLVLVIMAVTGVLMAILTNVGQIITSSDSMWAGFALNGAWAIGFIICAITLVHGRGARGLALTYLIAYLLHFFWSIIYIIYRGNRANAGLLAGAPSDRSAD